MNESKIDELRRLYKEKDWWVWVFRRKEIGQLLDEIEALVAEIHNPLSERVS